MFDNFRLDQFIRMINYFYEMGRSKVVKRVPGSTDEWMNRWMDVKPVLRIA
jgi:hypothetical protein